MVYSRYPLASAIKTRLIQPKVSLRRDRDSFSDETPIADAVDDREEHRD